MVTDKKEEKEPYTLENRATQTEPFIVDENGEDVSTAQLLVDVANDVRKLTKHLVG